MSAAPGRSQASSHRSAEREGIPVSRRTVPKANAAARSAEVAR
jgi:hypothetical protein